MSTAICRIANLSKLNSSMLLAACRQPPVPQQAAELQLSHMCVANDMVWQTQYPFLPALIVLIGLQWNSSSTHYFT